MEKNKKMFKAKGAISIAGRSNRKSTSLIRQIRQAQLPTFHQLPEKYEYIRIWKQPKKCLRQRNKLRQVTVGRFNRKTASLIRPKETVERILNFSPANRKI